MAHWVHRVTSSGGVGVRMGGAVQRRGKACSTTTAAPQQPSCRGCPPPTTNRPPPNEGLEAFLNSFSRTKRGLPLLVCDGPLVAVVR